MKQQNQLTDYVDSLPAKNLLTKEEEVDLARRYQLSGDMLARNRLVEQNLRLVFSVSKKYVGMGVDEADLISEGNYGLIIAAQRFDPDIGTRFSTYACWWIRRYILEAINRRGKTIRTPDYLRTIMARYRQVSCDLHGELGREPTSQEVASAIGATKKQSYAIRRGLAAYGTKSDQDCHEFAAVGCCCDPSARMMHRERSEKLKAALAGLDPLEFYVLSMYYDLSGEGPKSLEEIAKEKGCTREWVRQIKFRTLQKLRKKLGSDT